ncbi:MAG: DNA polymerase III subunit beta [Candidatus Dasytiphilus stammeri]
MQLIIQRESLLQPLQKISRILNHKPLLPIVNNVLLKITNNKLCLTVTNLEIEIFTHILLTEQHTIGTSTVSAKKLLDICRYLPEKANINISLINNRIFLSSGRSKFYLSTLPVKSFPTLEDWNTKIEFSIQANIMKHLIEATHFCMSYQDIRYYLNGLLLEIKDNFLYSVATDGHRIAICKMEIIKILPKSSVILPRKFIIELLRLLKEDDSLLKIQIGTNNIRIHIKDYIFTSRLIDGTFPNYSHILHKNYDKIIVINREILKQSFLRISILCNYTLNEVHLYITKNELKIITSNLSQEEGEEKLPISYEGDDIRINLNINYILDVLSVLKCDTIKISLLDSMSSIQINDIDNDSTIYVIMPMKF